MLKGIFRNPIFSYIFSRYLTYGVQFVNSVLIAVLLGPLYLGIWGFISLIVQYLAQTNFGISHSTNAIISTKKDNHRYISIIVNNSFSMTAVLCGLVLIVFCLNYVTSWNIGAKYDFLHYSWFVALIAITAYYNSLYSTIFRVYGKLKEIAFNQSIFPVLTVLLLPFFKGELLLKMMVWVYLISNVVSLLIYVVNSPFRIKMSLSLKVWKIIQRKGLYLFIYNSCFYLIIISTRTFISTYYTIEDFGVFTFAFSLGNVILLMFDSFSFVIFPKVLNKFYNASLLESASFLDKIRKSYITGTHFIVHIVILVFPCFLYMFPSYSSALGCFRLIVLTLALLTNSFGYQGLLIAKNREKLLGIVSLCCLGTNVAISLFLILAVKVKYQDVILATTLSYLSYSISISYFGNRLLGRSSSLLKSISTILPVNLLIPFLISLTFTLFELDNLYFFIPLLLFIILNYDRYMDMKNSILSLANNPKLTEI